MSTCIHLKRHWRFDREVKSHSETDSQKGVYRLGTKLD